MGCEEVGCVKEGYVILVFIIWGCGLRVCLVMKGLMKPSKKVVQQ